MCGHHSRGTKDKDQKRGASGIGGYVETTGVSRGRSTVATKRLRLLMLHGNSAAASLLLQVRVDHSMLPFMKDEIELGPNSCGKK